MLRTRLNSKFQLQHKALTLFFSFVYNSFDHHKFKGEDHVAIFSERVNWIYKVLNKNVHYTVSVFKIKCERVMIVIV